MSKNLAEKIEKLEQKIDELQNEIEREKAAKLRAVADLQNFLRREKSQRENWSARAIAEFLRNFCRNFLELELCAEKIGDAAAKKVIANFFAALEKFGFKKILPKNGETADENWHEILLTEKSKFADGKISRVLEPGWKFGEILLRPAKIAISKNKK